MLLLLLWPYFNLPLCGSAIVSCCLSLGNSWSPRGRHSESNETAETTSVSGIKTSLGWRQERGCCQTNDSGLCLSEGLISAKHLNYPVTHTEDGNFVIIMLYKLICQQLNETWTTLKAMWMILKSRIRPCTCVHLHCSSHTERSDHNLINVMTEPPISTVTVLKGNVEKKSLTGSSICQDAQKLHNSCWVDLVVVLSMQSYSLECRENRLRSHGKS